MKNTMLTNWLLVAALLTYTAISATAHNVLLFPSKTTTSVGETVEVAASISEPLGVPDMPFFVYEKGGYVYGPLKLAAFESNRATNLEFSYVKMENGASKQLSVAEIETAYDTAKASRPDDPAYSVMAGVFNANAASYRIASRGTVTFAGMSSYGKDTVVKCLMKTFVNLAKDGESTKPRASYFGFDGLELRPVDDLAGVKPGKKVRLEALLNGKPQSGVVVYSGHKDIEESQRLSPILEYSEKADPILDAGVTDINGIVELTLPAVPRGSTELKDVYIFTDGHLTVEGVRYRSTINFTLKK
jgi:uncharacterized GH25 family protein